MFSGLIKASGKIFRNTRTQLVVNVPRGIWKNGDSVAINGVCLTIVDAKRVKAGFQLSFDVSEETLAKTTLAFLRNHDVVNVEPALTLSDSLGGHLVQGHVDGVGRIQSIRSLKASTEMWFKCPQHPDPLLVDKGSICIDGISLTVVDIKRDVFSVAVIPFTWSHTNFYTKKVGDQVNIEYDVMGKYVQKILSQMKLRKLS